MHEIPQSAENRSLRRTLPGRPHRQPWLVGLMLASLVLSTGNLLHGQAVLAPYVATPVDVVQRMLTLARVGPDDVVYDLGCGDGRVVIEAARTFGARGVGVDIDPALVARAQQNAEAAGVADRVIFRVQDAMTVDVSNATVVTLYLLAASNAKLRPTLMRDLHRGSRIVSHNFPIGDWEPTKVETMKSSDGKTRTLYLWSL
jgi:SAM-dependent methyltransferase